MRFYIPADLKTGGLKMRSPVAVLYTARLRLQNVIYRCMKGTVDDIVIAKIIMQAAKRKKSPERISPIMEQILPALLFL